MKFGTIVWIKAGDNRLVDQRAKVLRTGAGIVMCKTFAEHDNFITVPYDRICGIEMEEGHSIFFNVTGEVKSSNEFHPDLPMELREILNRPIVDADAYFGKPLAVIG